MKRGLIIAFIASFLFIVGEVLQVYPLRIMGFGVLAGLAGGGVDKE